MKNHIFLKSLKVRGFVLLIYKKNLSKTTKNRLRMKNHIFFFGKA